MDAAPSAPAGRPDSDSGPSLVVGLGGSAGGVEALEAFFGGLPEADGMAFVVVLHLDPARESQLAEVIQGATALPVAAVDEPVRLEAGHVYVIRPGQNLTVEDGVLVPTPIEDERHRRRPVDHFFRTLAEAWGDRAVAVVLSGTGSNGTVGAGLITEQGGLVLAQDPADAVHAEMPRSALAEGVADRALPAAHLGAHLVEHLGRLLQTADLADPNALDGDGVKALRSVLAYLRARTGHDFAHYKRSTVLRRIARRLHVTGADSLDAYLVRLRAAPDEAHALLDDLLISVTSFFRDPEAFEALQREGLPQLFEGKAAHDEVRVWVPGCATGEEAYTLAILLDEHASRLEEPPSFQVFATDLSEAAVRAAREGRYPGSIEADVSPERLQRYFWKEDGTYRVREDLRERVLFAPHSLLKDPPFSRVDLVSCRNLLIYLQRELQERVLELFHYALNPGGVLLLGSAESTDGASGLYRTLDKGARLYARREVETAPPRLPSRPSRRVLALPSDASEAEPVGRGDVASLLQRLQAEAAPPGLLLDERHDVVRLTDSAAPFLRFAGGAPTQNALKLVRPELQTALQTTLFQAGRTTAPAVSSPVEVEVGGEARRVRVHARPAPGDLTHVVFEALPAETSAPVQRAGGAEAQALHDELQETRENLQLVIEEYETSREELRAQNEELRSINEELRSTAEELETAKEEAQSTAEELQTVNDELKATVDETTRAKGDLENLVVSTEIATLFLDRKLRIQRFTPRVREHFHILSSDLGRPLADLAHRFEGASLIEDAEAVLETLEPREREVRDDQGQWFLVHVRPYRTVDDRIDGVVVTFVDITERRWAEAEVREAKVYAESIIETLHEPLLVLTPDLHVRTANAAFYEHFEVAPDETLGRRVYDLGNNQWDIPELRTLLEDVLPDNNVFNDYEVAHDFEDIGERVMLINARRLDHVQLILLGVRDITEQKRAEDALRESEERFRAVAELVPDLLWRSDPDGTTTWYNRRWLDYTGQTFGEATGWVWADAIHPDDRARSRARYQRAVEAGESLQEEHRIRRHDGAFRWFLVRAEPVRDEAGVVQRWFGAATDVHEQRTALEALRTSEERLRFALDAAEMGTFVWFPEEDRGEPDARMLALFGLGEGDTLSLAEALGRRIHPDDRARYAEAVAHATDPGGDGRLAEEIRVVHPDGSIHCVSVTAQVAFEGAPQRPVRMYGVAADVTERKRAEDALRESEERLRQALEAARLGAWSYDPDADVTRFDARAREILGLEQEKLPSSEADAVIHPDDRDAFRAARAEALGPEGGTFSVVHRVVRPNGRVRWVRGQAHVAFEGEGDDRRPVRAVGVVQDVTEAHEADAALRESEERFRTLAETVPDAVFTTAPDGTVDYVNRQHTLLTGVDPAEVIGTTMWPELVHPDDREATEAAWAEALAARKRYEVRYRLRSQTDSAGDYCWVIVRARPVLDEDGVLDRWFGTITDVDALARAEEEVRQLNATLEARVEERTQEVREMAVRLVTVEQDERERIAHVLHDDLQQQLVGLSMTLDLLRRPAGGAPVGEEAKRLHDQAERILGDSIDIARTLAAELSPAVLDAPRLGDLLRWLALRKESLHGMDVSVEVEEPCEVTDRPLRVLLYQTLQEILLNVVKHAGTKRARLRAWTESGFATVRVADDGDGFDPAEMPAGGGGFGLPHVRERVEKAGGWLSLESAPGEGTRVTVAVPVSAPESDAL